MNRRGFLIRFGGGLAATLPLSSVLTGCAAPAEFGVVVATPTPNPNLPPAGFSADAWQTIAAVQAHLLPSEPGAPGAREIHAGEFLRGVLADPKLAAADRASLIHGTETLGKLARDMTGKPFVELSNAEREKVLRGFETTPEGRRWLVDVLGYLMEALLGDPVYGGNPDGVGWNWLSHTPGFPRPPAVKRYFLL